VLTFDFYPGTDRKGPLQVLAVGAHPDDIEIGCAGTILRLAAEHPGCHVRWVVLSGSSQRAAEARASARALVDAQNDLTVEIHDFRDGHFPFMGSAIKDVFEALKSDYEPDLILTHRREDLHQDHRFVAGLTWQTFRHHLILEYEIPKYEGDLGAPNLFVVLPESICERKVGHLLEAFASQRERQWFSAETFWGLMRLRGIEADASSKFAEGFTCRKMIL
jgi:LmbE family N-acetylglucosaminyl deacetylase